MELKTFKRRATIVKMQGTALLDGQVVAEAVVMCKIVDLPAKGEAPQG